MAARSYDSTELLATGFGVLIALMAAATLVGMPWQYQTGGALLAAGRIVGSVLVIGVGLATAWFALRN